MRPSRAFLSAAAAFLFAQAAAACGDTAAPTNPNHPAPLLVQVENLSAARPQSGLQSAAIVYEYVTEGGISRFSVIYTKTPSGRVGPVRSARLVTIALARIYGAVVVFSGGSTYIKGQIQAAGIPNADETSASGGLFRVGSRYPPHNLYSDGSHLSEIASNAKAPPVSWSMWQRTPIASVSGGTPVKRVTVPVSYAETPTFSYDPAAGGWKRSEPDTGPFLDADTGSPIVISTLIVQQVIITPSSAVVDVNGQTGVDHMVIGTGDAQVFTAGREFAASWTQGPSGPPTFSVPGGHSVPIAPGLVWICLVAKVSPAS